MPPSRPEIAKVRIPAARLPGQAAVVRARQQMLSSPDGSEEPATGRAVELLDELLGRLPV